MGYLLAVVAVVLWATLGILGKFLYRYGADPLTVVTIRAIIAFATLATILAVVDRAYVLENGCIVLEGTAEEPKENP